MSRSYKKNGGWIDRNPFCKNQANRRIRRIPVEDHRLVNGKIYKKFYCSYDICDHKYIFYGRLDFRLQADEDRLRDLSRGREPSNFWGKEYEVFRK